VVEYRVVFDHVGFFLGTISMWLFKQSSPARTVLLYISIGALIVIWTGVWYVYLLNNPPETPSAYYWCTGFLVPGLTMVLIGWALGHLGRTARAADLTSSAPPAPSSSPLVVVNPPAHAAAAPVAAPVAVPVNPVAVGVGQDGPVVLPSPQGNGLFARVRSQESGVR
jgi:hypothetical protein